MKRWMRALVFAWLGLTAGAATADRETFGIVGRPDGHAPISVMGEHVHHKGEWMVSYRFMFMDMDGNRDSTSRLGVREVLGEYPVSPTKMDMEMHMLGVMYGVTDRVTVMAMMPFARLDMDHRTRMGVRFRTRSNGIGDLKLTGLVRVWERATVALSQSVRLNAGLSVPTGNYHNRDATPAGNVRLPYPMQIGSGTTDLLPGITYTAKTPNWSGGAQLMGVIRLGRNSRNYSKGDGIQVQGWIARRLTRWLSTSFRTAFVRQGNYDGRDKDLNPAVVPTADPRRRGFNRVELGVGLNFIVPSGVLAGNRFAVEFGYPAWQKLQGPQLESDWTITAGWQLAFGGTH